MVDIDEVERSLRADADEIVANLRTLRRLVLRTAADIGRSGLTGPQISVQMLLVVNGPMTVGDLGRDLGLCHSTVSGIVDRLEVRGLVQRTPDPFDRRCTRIAITPAVQRYVQDLADSPEAPASRLVEALRAATPEERRKVTEGLSLLRRLLDRSSGPQRSTNLSHDDVGRAKHVGSGEAQEAKARRQ